MAGRAMRTSPASLATRDGQAAQLGLHAEPRRARLSALRCAAAGLLALTACVAHAEQAPRTYHFSGAELLAAIEGNMPSGNADVGQRQRASAAFGQAYVVGVADLSQGRLWCTRTGVLPHELVDRVHTYLTDLPANALRGNAATLTGQALRRAFPCATPAGGR